VYVYSAVQLRSMCTVWYSHGESLILCECVQYSTVAEGAELYQYVYRILLLVCVQNSAVKG
jgi:hypothetical protein